MVIDAHALRHGDALIVGQSFGGVHEDFQGTRLRERPSRPLCAAVLEETARLVTREGYERVLAIVAEQNEKSVRLITRAGFTSVTLLDGDYALYQAAVPATEDAS